MKNFKNYLGLWLILFVAFAAFTVVSASEKPLTIFGHELKSSEIWPTVTKSGKTTSEVTVDKGKDVIAQSRKAPAPSAKKVAVDNSPKTILFFGDSMLDGLYPRLAAYAKENGHTMYAVIWYSSTTAKWGNSDKLRKYIRDLKPDYIFVSLGANELYTKWKNEERDRYIKNIVADIGNIPYIWIGPPNWKPKNGPDLNELIAGNVGADHFFYSADLKFPRMKDGAHPTHEAAIGWMDKIIDWMKTHSSHPIKMNKPTEKKGRAKRVFVHQPNEN